jgi:toxin ParE1/3/4
VNKLSLTLSELAASDIVEQADWYQEQSGSELAKRWEQATTSALLSIFDHPHAGTPCVFHQSELKAVRRVSIPGFPRHLIFYQTQAPGILVLRVLHGARDWQSLF